MKSRYIIRNGYYNYKGKTWYVTPHIWDSHLNCFVDPYGDSISSVLTTLQFLQLRNEWDKTVGFDIRIETSTIPVGINSNIAMLNEVNDEYEKIVNEYCR